MFAPGGIAGLIMMHRPLCARRHAAAGCCRAYLALAAGADARRLALAA